MEDNSEGDNNQVNGSNNKSKPKRKMKTPFQLETLEKAYALETYPSEVTRAELSEKLGLTDRQLQMWFCHRRLKDKKDTPTKNSQKGQALPPPRTPVEEIRGLSHEPPSDYGSGSGSGSSPFMERKAVLDDLPAKRRYQESSPQSVMELRAIACVEAQLGGPIREDGPILGMEFDPLPPDAFGTPIEQQKWAGYPYKVKGYEQHGGQSTNATTQAIHEHRFLQDPSRTRSDAYGQVSQSTYHDVPVENVRVKVPSFVHDGIHGVQGQLPFLTHFPQQDKKEHAFLSPRKDENGFVLREILASSNANVPSVSQSIKELPNTDPFPDARVFHNDTETQLEKKRKSEAKLAKEIEAHEIRMRKELEKQELLRRKNEERMRKEMERLDRERRKEEERLMRERQREEERYLREQKRELERREKFLLKEYLRAEKQRQKEELRREKEALRRKAAIEKAAARKIAKESLDLIEDEQLELMELAAASMGLPSIVQLDYDNLENLELLRGSLSVFPPKSVLLKKPFPFLPWKDSEENIGNLLMVWRFLITFADILGLWPFTLNEFVQAFHDYDSRLLSEIHVSLLKLIIKDIEDVARTPSTGLGTNQNGVANPEGGHPQIVEGAYSWGFDIRNWQHYLNPLTWNEIFRQLALAAGFGPQLKKRNMTWTIRGNGDEVKGCEDLISTLRSGSAAENAFALMREKGLLHPRRSRHRLTPGTVKFAAFHVLSLEGSKGLTVLELADKIQKSGLRDLTTSKTPEASISVALTRDQKLFERIAPSTYCVRAAFRKDPADAEAVLSAARKKIKQFENGFLGGDDVDDVERDEEFDGDVDEDAEIDYLATPVVHTKGADHPAEASSDRVIEKENTWSNDPFISQDDIESTPSVFNVNGPRDTTTPSSIAQCVPQEDKGPGSADREEFEIDESQPGASWVRGLTEGEYSYLSVEERIEALVALVDIANEGNSIRVALEERLEAANALKKQMWAEAQLDRSRFKEDVLSKIDFNSFTAGKAETQVTGSATERIRNPSSFHYMKTEVAGQDGRLIASSATESNQNPLTLVNGKTQEEAPSYAEDQKENPISSLHVENSLIVQEPSSYPDNVSSQQQGYVSKRSRSKVKAYVGHLAEEMYVYRSLPLGQDRRRNRYWQFVASTSSNDPCSGWIFVELHDGKWRVIDCEEAFDTLLSSLDARGVRESHLRIMLQKVQASFKEGVRRNLQKENLVSHSGTIENEHVETYFSPNFSAPIDSPNSIVCSSNDNSDVFGIELGRNQLEKKGALKRYQDFQKWMWKKGFNPSTLCAPKDGKRRCPELLSTCELCLQLFISDCMHCPSCHETFHSANKNFSFSEHRIRCEVGKSLKDGDPYTGDYSIPIGIKLLKALLALVEASIPQEAVESFWHGALRSSWGMKLNMSSSPEELLQVLTQLESIVKQDYLSPSFEMTKELLGFPLSLGDADHGSFDLESIPILPWVPKTTAAVALRLFELDASIIYVKQEKPELSEDKSVKVVMKLPSKFSPQQNEEAELKELKQEEYIREDNLVDSRSRNSGNKRVRSSQEQRGMRKLPKKSHGFKSDRGRQDAKNVENSSLDLRQRRQMTEIPASGRGRRTVRKRREATAGEETLLAHMNSTVGPSGYGGQVRQFSHEWVPDQAAPDDSNSMEAADSDDNMEPEDYEQGMWEQTFNGTVGGWNTNPMVVSDDGRNGSEYGDDIEEDSGDEDFDGDSRMTDGSNGVVNRIRNNGGGEFSIDSDDFSD